MILKAWQKLKSPIVKPEEQEQSLKDLEEKKDAIREYRRDGIIHRFHRDQSTQCRLFANTMSYNQSNLYFTLKFLHSWPIQKTDLSMLPVSLLVNLQQSSFFLQNPSSTVLASVHTEQ